MNTITVTTILMLFLITSNVKCSEDSSPIAKRRQILVNLIDEALTKDNNKLKETCMLRAIAHGWGDCVDRLFQAGVNPNLQDAHGNNLLMLASVNNKLDIVKILLRQRHLIVDLSQKNKEGKTLQQIANPFCYLAILIASRMKEKNDDKKDPSENAPFELLDHCIQDVTDVLVQQTENEKEKAATRAIMDGVHDNVRKFSQDKDSPLYKAMVDRNYEKVVDILRQEVNAKEYREELRMLCEQSKSDYQHYAQTNNCIEVFTTAVKTSDIGMLAVLHKEGLVTLDQIINDLVPLITTLAKGNDAQKATCATLFLMLSAEECIKYAVAAAARNDLVTMRALVSTKKLQNSIDWNDTIEHEMFNDINPLMTAALNGSYEVAEYLLHDCRVNPNVCNGAGQHALFFAMDHIEDADENNPKELLKMIRLLLNYKANPNLSDNNGLLPVFNTNHKSVMELLHPTDVNYQDEQGDTALIKASRVGDRILLAKLMAAKKAIGYPVDLAKKNKQGKDAIDLANTQEIANYIKRLVSDANAAPDFFDTKTNELSFDISGKADDKRDHAAITPQIPSGSQHVQYRRDLTADYVKGLDQQNKDFLLGDAINKKFKKSIAILIDGGANTDALDSQGQTMRALAKKAKILPFFDHVVNENKRKLAAQTTHNSPAPKKDISKTPKKKKKKKSKTVVKPVVKSTTTPPQTPKPRAMSKQEQERIKKEEDLITLNQRLRQEVERDLKKREEEDELYDETDEQDENYAEGDDEGDYESDNMQPKSSSTVSPGLLKSSSSSSPIIASQLTPFAPKPQIAVSAPSQALLSSPGSNALVSQYNDDDDQDYEGDCEGDDYEDEGEPQTSGSSLTTLSLSNSPSSQPIMTTQLKPVAPQGHVTASAPSLLTTSNAQISPHCPGIPTLSAPEPKPDNKDIFELLRAARNGNLALLKACLSKKGMSVNAHPESGNTPLMAAVFGEAPGDVIQYLLDQKAEIGSPNALGQTALYAALIRENLSLFGQLATLRPDLVLTATAQFAQTKKAEAQTKKAESEQLRAENRTLNMMLGKTKVHNSAANHRQST